MVCGAKIIMLFSVLDIISLLFFVLSWAGYTRFARIKAKSTNCIARSLHKHRIHWMTELMHREIRVGEAALLANLERNIAFFASTTLLVLAGVLTLFAQVDYLVAIISSFSYAHVSNDFMVQIKLCILGLIFVIAFFQFTWSMRQYGFVNVMVGAAPFSLDKSNKNLLAYANQMAIVQDQAAHSYNYGLRSYYFSLAVLSWFFHPVLFILSSVIVVYTLYTREFKSKAVRAITKASRILEQQSNFNDNDEKL